MTALCSTALTRQWSPGRSQPRRTMFSPMVFPLVRMQQRGSPWRNRRHSPSRSSRAVSPASRAEAWAPRFREPPTSVRQRSMAWATAGGLGKDVAALSR